MMNTNPETFIRVSVIIPAFNEERSIAEVLTALELQTLGKTDFEIILIDNGSEDRTVELARGFQSRVPMKIVSLPEGSISSVRNYGASLARGAVLAFLDADCVAKPTWLKNALELSGPDRIWGAHYVVPEQSTWVGSLWADYQAKEDDGPTSFIPGGNLFVEKQTFNRIGGFNEGLQTAEDVELSLRAQKNGLNTVAFPILAVAHLGTPQTLRHFYRQNRWHGMNVIRVFFENLPSTKNAHLIFMSVYILVLFWITLLCSLIGLWVHNLSLAAVPAILLFLPAVSIAIYKAVVSSNLKVTHQLFVLYMTYFLARAASALHSPRRNHR